ncbi:PPE domain-containing protein [Mycobacterium sherrisii]|uniref:PPE domain-containing protein n=1 Tax=Mycobacterium sherrisii TaxID=243061 RepID=UPI002DDD3FF9|nr:PPE domain-containing protein [Mycobacterium sherrisii]MEC4764223.1 PPE domain-containing protein [Mycobacterium sherrisii]
MPDPRWTGPPEIVAAIFEAGSPASVLANNAVWVTETANKEVATGMSAVNTLMTAAQWQGVGAVASVVTSTGLNAGLQTLVGWTAEKIGITTAAVEAFMIARSSVIPSLVSQTNRDEWTVLNATNFFGQNTPGIVERDTEYFGEHWPHNSSIGWTYSGALAALVAALAVPPPVAPMGASPAAPAAAAATVAQAGAQSGMNGAAQVSGQATQGAGQAAAAPAEGGGQLSSLMQQPLQMISGVTEPLQQAVKAPMDALQGLGSMPQGLLSSMTGAFSSAGGANAAAGAAEPILAGATGPLGGGGASGAGGLGGGGFPGAGLTSYTRPTSSFEPETGGRPTSLRAGVLNAAELRGPASPTTTGMGGSPMPMSPAGMLGHGKEGQANDKDVAKARVVVGGEPNDQQV